MKIATIRWVDAFAYDDCQKPDQEFPIYDVVTSGTVIKETEEYITVCRDYFEGKGELDALARYSISIPKKMIVAIAVEDTDGIFNRSN
jgi:hypothetical protein